MRFDIITIFPQIFDSYFNESILKRAQKKKKIKINIHNLRDYTGDKHKTVDDRPYGGGPGMIMKIEPIVKALRKIKAKPKTKGRKIILLDPAGPQLDQKMAVKFSKMKRIVFICGRYEGIDARISSYIDTSVSIGPYVLSGGELPAMVVLEAVTRMIPGVLGHDHSNKDDTFSKDKDYIEYPQYTRPEIFDKEKVPPVLLSGNHGEIDKWRKSHIKGKKGGK
jgi:tRNA (guanine37-N1)-methyltransferase